MHQGELHRHADGERARLPGPFTGGNGLDSYVDLSVIKGTGNNFNCSDFTPAGSGSQVYGPAATLNAFPTTWAGATNLTNASGSATWSNGDTVTYKVTATLDSATPNTQQNKTTGTHSFTWEADNT